MKNKIIEKLEEIESIASFLNGYFNAVEPDIVKAREESKMQELINNYESSLITKLMLITGGKKVIQDTKTLFFKLYDKKIITLTELTLICDLFIYYNKLSPKKF